MPKTHALAALALTAYVTFASAVLAAPEASTLALPPLLKVFLIASIPTATLVANQLKAIGRE